ncbi:MAG: hypothetical protein GOU98_01135 [Candidatus Altiarchaeota archaeon]|nr:hypothetical protein [Candidatus Altiarchaeota archaeon]
MIYELGILAISIYGLIKYDDLIKVAALTSLITLPAIMLLVKSGAQNLVLLMLVIEAVPFAFSLLLLKKLKTRYYRRLFSDN